MLIAYVFDGVALPESGKKRSRSKRRVPENRCGMAESQLQYHLRRSVIAMSDDENNKKPVLSRPANKSWQAFKAWMQDFIKLFLGDQDGTSEEPDEYWQEKAKEFWAKAKPKDDQ